MRNQQQYDLRISGSEDVRLRILINNHIKQNVILPIATSGCFKLGQIRVNFPI